VDSKTAAVCVHRNLSVHVLIYIVLLNTIHHIKENLKFYSFTFQLLDTTLHSKSSTICAISNSIAKMIHLRNVNFNAKFATGYFCRRNISDILTSNGFSGSVGWTVSFNRIYVRMLCYHVDPFWVEHRQSFSTDRV